MTLEPQRKALSSSITRKSYLQHKDDSSDIHLTEVMVARTAALSKERKGAIPYRFKVLKKKPKSNPSE